MQGILLHCNSMKEAKAMQLALKTKLAYPVYLSFNEKIAHSIVKDKIVHLLVYETGYFKYKDYELVMSLREAGFTSPVVILAKKLSFNNFKKIEGNNLFFLSKPFNEKSLVGVIRKLMISQTMSQQKFKRFATRQMATMETFTSGENLPSQIYNLSKGGAYCEFFTNSSVEVGDLVKLKVNLEGLGSHYVVKAQIIWVTRNGPCTGGHGVGMKFITYDDIYRQLTDNPNTFGKSSG